MTIAELIERLQSEPDKSLPVLVTGYEGGHDELQAEWIAPASRVLRNYWKDMGCFGEHEVQREDYDNSYDDPTREEFKALVIGRREPSWLVEPFAMLKRFKHEAQVRFIVGNYSEALRTVLDLPNCWAGTQNIESSYESRTPIYTVTFDATREVPVEEFTKAMRHLDGFAVISYDVKEGSEHAS